MIGPYGLKHCAVQPAIHRRTRAAARGADRASSWHPSRDLQRVRSEAAEALTCLVEKVLRHRDVDEQPSDTLGGVAHSVLVMPEQARLRILRRPSPPPRF